MIEIWRFLFKTRICVKPVTNITEAFGWQVLQLNTIQEFIDDYQRYGFKTAFFNIKVLWRIKEMKKYG